VARLLRIRLGMRESWRRLFRGLLSGGGGRGERIGNGDGEVDRTGASIAEGARRGCDRGQCRMVAFSVLILRPSNAST